MRRLIAAFLPLVVGITVLGGCDASSDIARPSDDSSGSSTCADPPCGESFPPPVVLTIAGVVRVGEAPVTRGDAVYVLVDAETDRPRSHEQPVSVDGRYGFSWTQATPEICASWDIAVRLQDGRVKEAPLFDAPPSTCSGDLEGPTIDFPYVEPAVTVTGTVRIREAPVERPVPAQIGVVRDSLVAWTTWADEDGDYELRMPWACSATALAEYSERSPTDPFETLWYNSGPAWPLFDVAPDRCEGPLRGPDLILVWTGPGFDPLPRGLRVR